MLFQKLQSNTILYIIDKVLTKKWKKLFTIPVLSLKNGSQQ